MVEKKYFDTTADGRKVDAFIISNNDMSVELLTYGATVNSIFVPDKNGEKADVLAGYDKLADMATISDYNGQTVGRYANRICGGKFSIDGTEYNVDKNENEKTCLHGGGELSHAVWNAIIIDNNAVEMTYESADGTCGFPGNVSFKVTFILTRHNELVICYWAKSDKKTIINMTNHAYFNLAGFGNGDILGHELFINAEKFTPVDADSIPTGEIRAVKGTPFDFTVSKPIGRDISQDDEQLLLGRGYDHNFCLNVKEDGPAAVAYDPESGRVLEVFTDLCGVQLYTGNFLDGTKIGKNGTPLIKHAGFCLETQFYPDTPNQPTFPQCTLDPSDEFESVTSFKFSVRK